MKDHTQYAEALALYTMNGLEDPGESKELQLHLRSCAECQGELESLRAATALLALSAVGPMPPQRSRKRLLDAIAREPRRVRSHNQRRLPVVLQPRWLAFAASAAALLLAVFSISLWRENGEMRRRLNAAYLQLQQQDVEVQEAKTVQDLLHAHDTIYMTLVSSKMPPPPEVKTIYSPQKGSVMLMASRMAPLPGSKVYELWLLPANGGAPIPAGTFTPDKDGNAVMMPQSVSPGIQPKAFAITIEAAGGSQTPTPPILMVSTG